ncbi:hypothetical protein CHGG_07787 [Chaetomium globosum CBS 148.51]|uniref:Protein kinase domain-containing protein n=1 Tax=Chaetomium globosum (strain ATCC 6205 / CBS 148.51 / DSM 1962 / NBRC 6347 / NRRL 1970) TaxID=306901 RepID=Q2GW67_CHAGB|nr:uncharacterized protein CHGG_07787 [Chaetomium globosum CBS 148.51]EAQ86534.1 hypothetical protein CHGG_07787 [Chaetomium globosum CBS 148.51]
MGILDSGKPAAAASPRSFAVAHLRPRNSFTGCSRITDYEVLGKLGEGTFGEVHRARSKKTGALVALKKIIMHNEKDGFPITALREIKLLKLLSHVNVLRLEEMAVEHPARSSKFTSRLLDNPSVHFTEPQIKCYMLQLLEGLKYLHENHILHRDMKAANLLIDNKGILQIADFGPCKALRGRAIDMWGVGCVFGEMLVGKPILAGESDGHQLEIIFELCGTPTDENMPGWRSLPGAEALQPRPRQGNLSQRFREYGSGAVSLLRELLRLDWRSRVNAIDALKHPYFQTTPLPAKPHELPSFEESHELDRRKFHDRRAALPPAPKGGTVGRGPHDGPNASFSSDGFGSRNGVNSGRYPRGSRGPEERVPAWHRDRGLPPRPPPPSDPDHPDGYRDRGSGRPRGGGGGRPDVDTYIPSYDRDAPRRDDRRRRDDRDDRRHDWDRRRDYDDRARTSRTRSRSRSPVRDRERDRDRDRERDRDRDPYRR